MSRILVFACVALVVGFQATSVRGDDDEGVPAPTIDQSYVGPTEDRSLNLGSHDETIFMGGQTACVYAYQPMPAMCPGETGLVCDDAGEYCVGARESTRPSSDVHCLYETVSGWVPKCSVGAAPCYTPPGSLPVESWTYEANARINTDVAIGPCRLANGTEYPCLYVGDTSGTFVAIRSDASNPVGACQWQVEPSPSGPINSSPAVWRDPNDGIPRILVGSDKDRLYAFDAIANPSVAKDWLWRSADLGDKIRSDPWVLHNGIVAVPNDRRHHAFIGANEKFYRFELESAPGAPGPQIDNHPHSGLTTIWVDGNMYPTQKGASVHPNGHTFYAAVGKKSGDTWVYGAEFDPIFDPPAFQIPAGYSISDTERDQMRRSKPAFSRDGTVLYQTARNPTNGDDHGGIEAIYTGTAANPSDCRWSLHLGLDIPTVDDLGNWQLSTTVDTAGMTASASAAPVRCDALLPADVDGDSSDEVREVWDPDALDGQGDLVDFNSVTCPVCATEEYVDVAVVGQRASDGGFFAILDCGERECRDPDGNGPVERENPLILWAHKLMGQIRVTPAISRRSRTVYTTTEAATGPGHTMYALDLLTGKKRWTKAANEDCDEGVTGWDAEMCFHGPVIDTGLEDLVVNSGSATGSLGIAYAGVPLAVGGAVSGSWLNESLRDPGAPAWCNDATGPRFACGSLSCSATTCDYNAGILVAEGENRIRFEVEVPFHADYGGTRTTSQKKSISCVPGAGQVCAGCRAGARGYLCDVTCTGPSQCTLTSDDCANVPDGVCVLCGDATANDLVGSSGADVICAYGGNDVIDGGGGDDFLDGGDGVDTIYGWGGSVQVLGGAGDDLLFSRAPGELCNAATTVGAHLCGEDGDDTIDGCGAGYICMEGGVGLSDSCSFAGAGVGTERSCELSGGGTLAGRPAPCACPA